MLFSQVLFCLVHVTQSPCPLKDARAFQLNSCLPFIRQCGVCPISGSWGPLVSGESSCLWPCRYKLISESHRACGLCSVAYYCSTVLVVPHSNPKKFLMADSHRTPLARPASEPYQDRAALRSAGDRSSRGVYGRLSPPPGALMRRSDAGPPARLVPKMIPRPNP